MPCSGREGTAQNSNHRSSSHADYIKCLDAHGCTVLAPPPHPNSVPSRARGFLVCFTVWSGPELHQPQFRMKLRMQGQ